MKKPVQVMSAVVTGGLLFWPAHAEGPAVDGVGTLAGQLAASALPLHDVRTEANEPAKQRLRVLAQYTEEESESAEESGDGEATGDDVAESESQEEFESSTDAGDEYSAPTDGSMADISEDPLTPSDAVNEIPQGDQPEPLETTYAPEQGVTAAEAGGDDSAWKAKFATGFDYSSGDYGLAEDTDILFIPVTGQLDTRSWKFKLTVPYIRIEGPTGVVGGTDGPIIVDGESVPEEPAAEEEPLLEEPIIVENSGLGDIVASVTYKVPPLGEGAPFIDLTGKVKFPTADRDDFLGTGEFDFTGQADIFQAIGDLTLFGTIGYRVLGDPDGRDLNNGVLAGGGFAYKFNESFSGGGILDWREASTDTSDDPFEVVPYVVVKLHEDWALQAYGVFGLSDGSPDAGGGLQISVTFD